MSRAGPGMKAKFIPPPIDGLNLVDPPTMLSDTEARQLDNYYIYDWGIRERGFITSVSLPDGGYADHMIAFTSPTLQAHLINSSLGKTYRYTTAGVFTALSAVRGFQNAFQINKTVLLPDAVTGEVANYAIATDTYTANVITFSGAYFPAGGCGYQNRAYFWDGVGTVVQYMPAAAISGAVSSTFDFGQVFQNSTKVVCCSSWSYNAGQENEEFFVVLGETGEVLIYRGLFPADTSWELVTRVDLPAPLTYLTAPPFVRILKIGQDLAFNTVRGLIPLSKVLAGRSSEPNQPSYYSLSRKIGPILQGILPDASRLYPFAYFGTTQDLYVLNYERGAWSKFPGLLTGADFLTGVSCSTQPLGAAITTPPTSYTLVGKSPGGFYRINESATVNDARANYIYKTPFFDFGSQVQLQSKMIRELGRDMASSLITSQVKISTELDDTQVGINDTKTLTATDTTYKQIELAAPGTGDRLSYWFNKTGSGTALNEKSGFDCFYCEGGLY